MKKPSQLTILIIMLTIVAASMIGFILYIVIVNPTGKSITENIPAIISCVVVFLICVGFILFFIIPRKRQKPNSQEEKHLIDVIEEDDFNNYYFKIKIEEASEQLEHIFIKINGNVLMTVETTKPASIFYTIKLSLFLYLLLTPILIVTLFCFGYVTGIDKFLIFLLPTLCIILPISIPIYFRSKMFSYIITDKAIIMNFGDKIVKYNYDEIIKISLTYGIFHKNKKYGTIKIKPKKKKLRLFANSLLYIQEPERIYNIIIAINRDIMF